MKFINGVKACFVKARRDRNRRKWLSKLRKRNKNYDFSLITNNCIGGIIYHDLGLQFRSPTINLTVQNFPLFVEHFKHYMSCELIETVSDFSFPTGQLCSDLYPPITICFNHYKSFEEEKSKWNERKGRINYDNLFFLMECYNNYYPDEFEAYKKLPYSKNKAVLTHLRCDDVPDAHYISCDTGTVDNIIWAQILEIKNSGKRYLDEFDYVSFLNDR